MIDLHHNVQQKVYVVEIKLYSKTIVNMERCGRAVQRCSTINS